MNIKKIVGVTAAAAAIAAGAIGVGAPLARAGMSEDEGPFSHCRLYYNGSKYNGSKYNASKYNGVKVSSELGDGTETYLCVVAISPRPARRVQFDTHKTWYEEPYFNVTKDCHWNISPTGRGEGWCTIHYSEMQAG